MENALLKSLRKFTIYLENQSHLKQKVYFFTIVPLLTLNQFHFQLSYFASSLNTKVMAL